MIGKDIYLNIENCDPRTCISSKISKVNRIVANIFRKHLKPYDITDSQLTALLVITKVGDITQKNIADFLYLEKSTVNRNLKRLIDNEYIKNHSSTKYATTEKGRIFLESVIPQWHLAMDEVQDILGIEGVDALNQLENILTLKK